MFAAAVSATPLLIELAVAFVLAAGLLARRPLRRLFAALRHPVVTARRVPSRARIHRI